MIGMRRTLGLCLTLFALQAPAWARVDEPQDSLNTAIEMLERGRKEEALKAIQKLNATQLDQKAAYELWKSKEVVIWRDLLVEGGEFELAAKRIIELATAERMVRKNDKDAIQALVKEATTNPDAIERRRAVRALSSDHGEYAVPYLVVFLGESGGDDRGLLAMYALGQMDREVVVPLTESLKSDNAVLRRNVAMVLGNIGDARGAASLQWLATSDPDETVRKAAADSLIKMQAQGDPLSNFLAAGDAYYKGYDTALRLGQAGDVVWDWRENRLVGTPIPNSLYPSEMSKRQYFNALQVDPSSTAALAGLARAYVEMQTKIDGMVAAGKDPGDVWKSKAGEALTAINASGVDALDLALEWSVENSDGSTGAAVAQRLAPLARGSTQGLRAGLRSTDGAIRSESAVALGQIAARTRTPAGTDAVNTLAEAAARESLRIAAVIDGNAQSAEAVRAALEAKGAFATTWNSGLRALAALRRSGAVDVVIVADSLPDTTTSKIIDEIRADERMANTAVIVLSKEGDRMKELYADRIQGTMTGAEDVAAVDAALAKEMSGDRARAEDLAVRSSIALSQLAHQGLDDMTSALAGLTFAAGRADKVALPAMDALGLSGGPNEAGALVAILANDKRSDEARAAAGRALASLLGRHPNAIDAAGIAKVQEVIASQAAMPVREAAAQVVGSLTLTPAERAEIVRKLRN
jgi:CheY-like chemotaxis protein